MRKIPFAGIELTSQSVRWLRGTSELPGRPATSGSGKYIGFGLKIETGAERTTIVDIFDIVQQVRDTDIHLKVDDEQMADHTRK